MLGKGERKTDESTGIRTRRTGGQDARGLARTPFTGPLAMRAWDDPFSFVEAFDRQFEEMRRNMESLMFPTGSLFAAGPSTMRLPAVSAWAARVDLQDKGKEYLVTAELPGFSKEEVDIEVTDEGVTLWAARRQSLEEGSQESGYLARERSYSALKRTVVFPDEVNADGASATLKDGVLTLSIPKKHPVEEPKPRKVKVG